VIVISGALVLVALVLLVIGLLGASLGFVYASIGVSLASGLILVFGILQRRKQGSPEEVATPATPAVASSGTATAGAGSVVRAADKLFGRDKDKADKTDAVATVPEVTAEAEAPVGKVLVVAGRPRYHVEGCRYLTGKEADSVEVADARTDGFTACGVCKPDESLTAAPAPVAAAPVVEPAAVEEPAVRNVRTVKTTPVVSEVPATAAVKAAPAKPAVVKAPATQVLSAPKAAALATPVKKASAKAPAKVTPAKVAPPKVAVAEVAPAKVTPVKAAPAKVAAVKTAPVKAAPLKAAAAKAAPAKAVTAPATAPTKAPAAKAPAKASAVKAPAKAPAAKAPAKAAAPVKRGGVIVIPDRGKFHTTECRYVRGAEGTLELTRAAATKQGYEACGVCNP
jgi:hypothetical protein